MKKNEIFFETIKCNNGVAFNLEYHRQRIARTIMMDIDLNNYILPVSNDFLKCKVLYNKYGLLDMLYEPYTKRLIKSFKIIYDDYVEYSYKSLDRNHIESLFNQRENADEIIIIKKGLVTDTSIANIAIFDGDIWLTPKNPLLRGTARDRLLHDGVIDQANISVEMLKKAKKIALLNAMIDMDILEDSTILP